MEVNPRELIIYETEQGETPFSEWLDSLRDRSARARIRKRLDRVREVGWALPTNETYTRQSF
jgi:putative component of toxin-antitoxin plasmid stabilization module